MSFGLLCVPGKSPILWVAEDGQWEEGSKGLDRHGKKDVAKVWRIENGGISQAFKD